MAGTEEIPFIRAQLARVESHLGGLKSETQARAAELGISIARLEESKLDASALVEIQSTLAGIKTQLRILALVGGGALAAVVTDIVSRYLNRGGH